MTTPVSSIKRLFLRGFLTYFRHRKVYNSKDEEEKRFAAFRSNWATVQRANSANSGYTLELNGKSHEFPHFVCERKRGW